jgi:hypothetical protein
MRSKAFQRQYILACCETFKRRKCTACKRKKKAADEAAFGLCNKNLYLFSIGLDGSPSLAGSGRPRLAPKTPR